VSAKNALKSAVSGDIVIDVYKDVAKLRKLVEMLRYCYTMEPCGGCPINENGCRCKRITMIDRALKAIAPKEPPRRRR
jgi:hypothetical protein